MEEVRDHRRLQLGRRPPVLAEETGAQAVLGHAEARHLAPEGPMRGRSVGVVQAGHHRLAVVLMASQLHAAMKRTAGHGHLGGFTVQRSADLGAFAQKRGRQQHLEPNHRVQGRPRGKAPI
jgi:hypothetical protein